MSAVEVEPENEWLPDTRQCPQWCDKQHAEALAEGNGWERSQVHHAAAGGNCLSALRYADRHIRDWGGGWDLTIQRHPLGPDGGFRGPALIELDAHEPNHTGVALYITSGEARTLAAQLIAAADRVDLL